MVSTVRRPILPSRCYDPSRVHLGVRIRITNPVAEGINSKIMAIKHRVDGYRNREDFKTAIFFYCGGLDLYPR
jgi:hypothetical protein